MQKQPEDMTEEELEREFYHPPPLIQLSRTDALRKEIQRRADARIKSSPEVWREIAEEGGDADRPHQWKTIDDVKEWLEREALPFEIAPLGLVRDLLAEYAELLELARKAIRGPLNVADHHRLKAITERKPYES